MPAIERSGIYPSSYREFVVEPGCTGQVLLLSNWLVISLDEGRTCKFSGLGSIATQSAAFDPFRPGWIYASVRTAGIGGPVFSSVNFGQTWTSKSAPTSGALDWPSSLFVDPEQPNRLYAAASNGRLFVSVDGASTSVLSQQ